MTRDVSITVRLMVEDNEHLCRYRNADQALADKHLRVLFDDGHVTACAIERDGQRLAGLPFMTWERFERALEPYASK
jgi:hypothetical protein